MTIQSDTAAGSATADATGGGRRGAAADPAALAAVLRPHVMPWMATQPRGHWRVVQLALERRGLLGPRQRSMRGFARWLASVFPELGDAGLLANSMHHYKMSRGVKAKDLERLPQGAPLRGAVRLVEQKLDAD